MSNRSNPRRKGKKRTETGPRWENPNPGHGCNATHVARSRKKWKRIGSKTERRTGKTTKKYWGTKRVRPGVVLSYIEW